VTIWGEFSPIGRLFTLGSYGENYKSCPHFWATLSHSQGYALNLAKKWLGLHFGRNFSQTHPVTLIPTIETIETIETRLWKANVFRIPTDIVQIDLFWGNKFLKFRRFFAFFQTVALRM
jgi:hypothetical protein